MAENNGFMPTNNHLTRQLKAKKNKILVKYPIPSHNSHSKVPYIPKKKKKHKKNLTPKITSAHPPQIITRTPGLDHAAHPSAPKSTRPP
jgi:hypothetical protein